MCSHNHGAVDIPDNSRMSPNSRTLSNLRKTNCRRYAAMTFARIDAESLARRLGVLPDSSDRASAYEFGSRFEEFLLRDNARRLVSALRTAGLVSVSVSVIDLGGRPKNADRATTVKNLETYLYGRRKDPSGDVLVIGAAVPFPGGSDTASFLLPDALLLRDGQYHPVSIEVKAYEERGVLSPQESIDSAAAQCGLYSVAFEKYGPFGLSSTPSSVNEAILVFRDPGKRRGTAFSIDVSRMKALALAALEMIPANDDAFVREFGSTVGDVVSDDATLLSIPTSYCEVCPSFCPLSPSCERGISDSSRLLGDSFVRLVGVRDLSDIASSLVHGTVSSDDVGLQLLRDGLTELGRII